MEFSRPEYWSGIESSHNAGDLGLIPGSGRYSGEGKGYPLQYSGLKNSMDCIVHGVTKSQTWLSDFHFTSLHLDEKRKQKTIASFFEQEPYWYFNHNIILNDNFLHFFISWSNQINTRISLTHQCTMQLIMKLENKKEHIFDQNHYTKALIKSLTESFSSPHSQPKAFHRLAPENKWIKKPFLPECQITYDSRWLVVIYRLECEGRHMPEMKQTEYFIK